MPSKLTDVPSTFQVLVNEVNGHCFRNCLMTNGSNVYDHDCLPHGFNYLKRLPVLKSNQSWDIEFELLNSPVK
ncbi:hypothetical protein Peur_015528 [Populus x canadensis]